MKPDTILDALLALIGLVACLVLLFLLAAVISSPAHGQDAAQWGRYAAPDARAFAPPPTFPMVDIRPPALATTTSTVLAERARVQTLVDRERPKGATLLDMMKQHPDVHVRWFTAP